MSVFDKDTIYKHYLEKKKNSYVGSIMDFDLVILCIIYEDIFIDQFLFDTFSRVFSAGKYSKI